MADVTRLRLTKDLANFLHSRLVNLTSGLDLVANTTLRTLGLDSSRDLIDILRLGHSFQVVLQNLGKVVLQLRTSEVLQDLLPIRWVVIFAQIGLQLARQNLQRRTLADTVRSHQAQNLTRSREGKSVQFEAIRTVAMGNLCFEVGGQVDDVDGVKWALLRADTASDA